MSVSTLAAGTVQFERHTDASGRQFTWIGDQWFPARVNEDNEGDQTGTPSTPSTETGAALAATVVVRGTATNNNNNTISYVLDSVNYFRVITRNPAGSATNDTLREGTDATGTIVHSKDIT